jgi:transcriptional regulator with XRE-family HTH domain
MFVAKVKRKSIQMWLPGARIKEIRKKMGDSQEAFAKKLGISKGALQNYENGEREPTASTIVKIVEVGKVSFDWLLTGDGDMAITRLYPRTEPDTVKEKILQMLDGMEEEKQRDILKYTEEKKQLVELLKERKRRGGAA